MKKMKMKKGIMVLAAALIMAALVLTGCETPVDVGSVICTVRFSLEGGSFINDNEEDPPQPLSLTVNSGASVGLLPMNLEKPGYIFGGWYTERYGGGTLVTARTTVSGSITVYAKWIGKYTVEFWANNVRYGASTVNSGDSVGTLPTAPGRDGYTFGGWYTEEDGGGTQFTASTIVRADIRVYAKWMINQYTVTFDADGELLSGDEITRTVGYGDSVGTLPTAPGRDGYNFGGWYTEQNGEGSEFAADTPVTDTITVFAKWTPTGTITVTFTGPQDENINLNGVQDLSWSANDRLEVRVVSGGAAPYRWALDDDELEGENGNSLTLYAGYLSVKQHTLTVYVTKSGVEYAKWVNFTVTLL